jgi:hypothetical protein
MDINSIIAALDDEIERLGKARSLLANGSAVKVKIGKTLIAKSTKPVKRILSIEARKRIADAQHKRWAAARNANESATTAAQTKAARRSAPLDRPIRGIRKQTSLKKTATAQSKKPSPKNVALVQSKKTVSRKKLRLKTPIQSTEVTPS